MSHIDKIDNRLLKIKKMYEEGFLKIECNHLTDVSSFYEEKDFNFLSKHFLSLALEDDKDILKLKNLKLKSNSICQSCGKKVEYTLTDGIISSNSCNRVEEYSVEIDFPTGEIIVGDWIYGLGEIVDEPDFNINYASEAVKQSEFFASKDILHMQYYVCADILYKEKENLIIFGDYEEIEDENEEFISNFKGFDYIGSVSCNLRALTMMDKSVFDNLYLSKSEFQNRKINDILTDGSTESTLLTKKIKPGKYKCTSFVFKNKRYTEEEYIGIKVELIEEY